MNNVKRGSVSGRRNVHLDQSHNRSWSLVDVLYRLNNRGGLNLLITYRQKYSRHDPNMSYAPKKIGHSGDIWGRSCYEKGSLLMVDCNYVCGHIQ